MPAKAGVPSARIFDNSGKRAFDALPSSTILDEATARADGRCARRPTIPTNQDGRRQRLLTKRPRERMADWFDVRQFRQMEPAARRVACFQGPPWPTSISK